MSVLFNRFTQETRLLQLSTPLGADTLLAECARGEEGISCGYFLTISALSSDDAIELKSLLGQPVLLQLATAGSFEPRPFHGHVTAAECCGANGGFARYQLTLEPWTAFLARGRDSRVFQDKDVFDILDAIFSAYQGAAMLAPAWRFEIADRAVYPVRSHTCQYQESDLAFAERLMREEGLFYFFEHAGDPASPSSGSHTMVIADHNGAFTVNSQGTVRFTQPGAVMKEDSLDRWRSTLSHGTNAVELASWDYRTVGTRPVHAFTADDVGDRVPLLSRDVPGPYAYESRAQGQRIADNQLQAHVAARARYTGAGTVRTMAPGTTFTLAEHAMGASTGTGANRFLVVRVVHLMHNNLSAQLKAEVTAHLRQSALEAAIGMEQAPSIHATGSQAGERPLYRNRVDAIPAQLAYRSSATDGHGIVIHPRPSVRGQQTAIVVGPAGSVVHTDRDHRIKVQFHWQRGAQSHSRLEHPAPAGQVGAPGDDSAGTWVRVAAPMAPVAGSNWGSNALPRVGQEVLIDFLEGDIDRPVVIGSLYNGHGQDNAQNNAVAQGAGVATGNAPAWFPGDALAHAHPAALSGFKSQAMGASQAGTGAYSQLVFDDSQGQARVALQRHASAHQGTAELNMGQLRHQTDNQRLASAGFGAELKTEHGAALRAGAGMLLSSNARAGASGSALDSHEAKAQLDQALALQTALADTAHKHHAQLKGDNGQMQPASGKLPSIAAMAHSADVIAAQAGAGAGGAAAAHGDSGGAGQATAYAEPHLQLSSPAGIVAATPADAIVSAGDTSSITAGHDINFAVQGNSGHLVAGAISLFTTGKATAKDKPNQEAGIMLHAASGKLSMQSQSDQTRITADQALSVASITSTVGIAAKEHVLLTAQGAYIKLEGGNIMLHAPGQVGFKASTKEVAGPSATTVALPVLPQSQPIVSAILPIFSQQFDLSHLAYNDLTGFSSEQLPYRVFDRAGRLLSSGTTNDDGLTERILTNEPTELVAFIGDGGWTIEEYFASEEPSEVADQGENT